MPDVKVSDFGAVGDGVADDSAAINAAIIAAAGGEVKLDALEYGVALDGGYGIVVEGEGAHITGSRGSSAAGTGGTRIKALNPGKGALLIDKSYNVSITGLYINGNNKAENGIVCYRAAHDVLRDLMVRHCTDAGVLLDMYARTPNGSNNHLRLERVICHWNGYGLRTIEGNDNNAVNVIGCEMGSNDQHGILLKGSQWLIHGGSFEGNGEHAIQISEPGDQGYSMFNVLHGPWIESCGANHLDDGTWVNYGYRGGGKSVSNILYANGQMPFSNAPGSLDLHVTANSGSAGAYEIKSGFGARASIRPGYSSVIYASDGTLASVPMHLRPKNAPLHLCDQGQGVTIGGGSKIRKIWTVTVPWPDQFYGYFDTPVQGVLPGDSVSISHDSLGDAVIVLSANVYSSGVVRVIALSPRGDEIPGGTISLTCIRHS